MAIPVLDLPVLAVNVKLSALILADQAAQCITGKLTEAAALAFEPISGIELVGISQFPAINKHAQQLFLSLLYHRWSPLIFT